MLRRKLVPLLVLPVLLIPVALAYAQSPPDAINDALADLSARAGKTITLADLWSWQWTQTNYPDTSLGCPQPGQTYAQVVTNGYQFLLVYNGVTYDYRESADRSTLILCNSPAVQPTALPSATPTPIGTSISPAAPGIERIVCADAMATRLATGIQARATANNIPKNMRSIPSTSGFLVGQVAPGETVSIIGGPQCAEELVWWQIDYQTLVGWVAEGQYGVYWFEPLPAVTGSSMTPTVVPQILDLPSNRQPITADSAAQLELLVTLPVGDTAYAIAWSPDGATLAVSGSQGIWLYNTAAFSLPPRLLQVPGGATDDVVFSAEQNLMASAHEDTTVRIWDVSSGGQRAVLRGHLQRVISVAFSPDGKLLASGGINETESGGSLIRLWDVATGTQIAALAGHSGAVEDITFSPDGMLLASASQDRSVRLWDVVSGTPVFVLTGHTEGVRTVTFSPDGTSLASGGDDGTIRLWNLSTGEQQMALGEDSGLVAVLAFSPDGTLLVSAGGDSTVRLWNVAAGQLITTLKNTGGVVGSLVFSPDGTALALIVPGAATSTIQIWGAPALG